MVFKIFRNLPHLFSCHVLITIQWGRRSRYYDLHVAVEGTEVQRGWRSWGLLESRWAGPGPLSFASWPRYFVLDMTDESSHEAKDSPILFVAMILGLNICQTPFWRRKKTKIHLTNNFIEHLLFAKLRASHWGFKREGCALNSWAVPPVRHLLLLN